MKEIEQLMLKFPKLKEPVKKNGVSLINGHIDIIDANEYIWDTYSVLILIPNEFPTLMPELIELDRKIERDPNWHVNKHGVCCLGTDSKIHHELGDEKTLINWMDKFAVPFLANHKYKKVTGAYANGEFSHGHEGLLEFYFKLFNVTNKEEVIKQIRLILGINSLSSNQKCFCNSDKKYKRCFLLQPEKHRYNIPIKIFKDELREILKQ